MISDLEPDCELLAVQIGVTRPVIVAVCYRPPEADDCVRKIFDFVRRVRNSRCPLLIVGDFNLPEIAWSQQEVPVFVRRTQRAVEFLDELNEYGLSQSVYEPTRGDATLDLVLSCGGDAVTVVRDGSFDSDHRETITDFTVSTQLFARVSRTTAFNYREADFDGLRASLRCLPWDVLSSLDVNSATELFL